MEIKPASSDVESSKGADNRGRTRQAARARCMLYAVRYSGFPERKTRRVQREAEKCESVRLATNERKRVYVHMSICMRTPERSMSNEKLTAVRHTKEGEL